MSIAMAAPAQAAFPGKNGKVTFVDENNLIRTINPDGTGLATLGYGQWPAWSPDGKRVAFASNESGFYSLYLMNADGTARTRITNGHPEAIYPAWSPDGRTIAFDGSDGLDTINPDGTDLKRITNGGLPSWSPDGKWIAFDRLTEGGFGSDIYVSHPDGTGERQVTNLPGHDAGVDWSPDGSRLSFNSCNMDRCADQSSDVYTVKPDGTDLTRLTEVRSDELYRTAWSPDGTKIIWGSERSPQGVWIANADGTDQHQLTGAGIYDVAWQPIPGPKRSDYKNSNQFCKAEQAFWGDQFSQHYRSFGQCVSGR
jgi:Tol biopolymer transport system component